MMTQARRLARLLLLFALLLPAAAVHADLNLFDKMITPGDVITGHAKFEHECSNCHKKFSKKGQNQMCLACHDHSDIAQDIRTGQGFHGRHKGEPCKSCHTEHKGRKAKIVILNKQGFDHRQTDFPLHGKHLATHSKCSSCHKPGTKYRDAPHRCVSCHRSDDKHHGTLGASCENCHSDKGWKVVTFDHSKTDFPLHGAHRRVKCRACHKAGIKAGAKAKKLPTSCYGCHVRDDKHRGALGKKCDSCHVEQTWKTVRFDHAKTRFPLHGAHRLTACRTCHLANLRKPKPPTNCYGCHVDDDVHKGQEGRQCADCHNEQTWKTALFDHGLTKFPLLGRHTKVKCSSCHRTKRFQDAPTQCVSCHRSDDAHKKRLGSNCGLCHDASSWKHWIFDHNKQTGFVLDGAHHNLACVSCHVRPTNGRPTLSGACNDCHAQDDVHEGEFGQYCERCHVTSKFNVIRNLPTLLH